MKNIIRNYCTIIGIIILLGSCTNIDKNDGVIATVNGEKITFHSLDTILDAQQSSSTLLQDLSFENTQKNYVDALCTLIIHALVRQDLMKKGLLIKNDKFENEISLIINDFPEDNFKKYLDESFMNEVDWKNLMKDYFDIIIFMERVLLPKIKVTREEIEQYYKEHEKEFILPESMEVMFISSENKNDIIEFCKYFPTDISSFSGNLYVQKQTLTVGEVHANYRNLKHSASWTCGEISNENKLWKTIATSGKNKPRKLELIDVYPLIENVLLKAKLNEEFDQWLNNEVQKSKIFVIPELRDALVKMSSARVFPE